MMKKENQIAIIGKYTTAGGVSSDGQAVKTTLIAQEVERALGQQNVRRINTFGWKKHPVKLMLRSLLAVRQTDHVIFMTDEGGIKVFPWMLLLFRLLRKTKLHYVVVGGWLIHFAGKHGFIRGCLKKFDAIYVETTVMKRELDRLGFENVILMPNFKRLELADAKPQPNSDEPLRFCTFSRIMREKGIDDAAEAVCAVNGHFGRTVCTLDIYGRVDPDQTQWFEDLQAAFPQEIRYCGVVDYDRSTEVLQDYFALLFPTEFFTEGVPGTIIDAYAAGVPVIAAQWESFADVVEDGVTGIGYPFGEQERLKEILIQLVEHPEIGYSMKANCLEKARQYLPDTVMEILLSRLS